MKDNDNQIAFRTPTGKEVLRQGKIGFELVGNNLQDADDTKGPLFGCKLPRIQAASFDDWREVKTIIVGEEGRGREKPETIELTPDSANLEIELPPEIVNWQASWFFIRFYDQNKKLIDEASMDFRLARTMQKIEIDGGQPQVFPTDQGHAPSRLVFYHNVDCTLAPPSSLRHAPTQKSEGKTEIQIPADQEFDKTRWQITESGHDSVDITILTERVWWAVVANDATPHWVSMPFHLTLNDFSAGANKRLWIHLPRPRWTEENIDVGFSKASAKQIPVRANEQTASIPLHDLRDSQELGQTGVMHLQMRAADKIAPLAVIRVKAKCLACQFSADSEQEVFDHIASRHIFPLTYAEHRQRDSTLPLGIAICMECDYVARAMNPRQNLTDMMREHARQMGHVHEHYEELKDTAKIAARLPDLPLPDIRICKLCEREMQNPSLAQLMNHLRTDPHPGGLYKLA